MPLVTGRLGAAGWTAARSRLVPSLCRSLERSSNPIIARTVVDALALGV